MTTTSFLLFLLHSLSHTHTHTQIRFHTGLRTGLWRARVLISEKCPWQQKPHLDFCGASWRFGPLSIIIPLEHDTHFIVYPTKDGKQIFMPGVPADSLLIDGVDGCDYPGSERIHVSKGHAFIFFGGLIHAGDGCVTGGEGTCDGGEGCNHVKANTRLFLTAWPRRNEKDNHNIPTQEIAKFFLQGKTSLGNNVIFDEDDDEEEEHVASSSKRVKLSKDEKRDILQYNEEYANYQAIKHKRKLPHGP